MARFPKTEAEIMMLAQDLVTGFAANPDSFPNPPIPPASLTQDLAAYAADRDAAAKAQAAAIDATAHKQSSLDTLCDHMKTLLRYAESVAANDQQLAAIGWSGRTAPAALQAPGQPRMLEASLSGIGWVTLDWKPAQDGGKAAAYDVQRRELPDGDWGHACLSIGTEITLTDQPKGKLLEYRVLAANRVGNSEPSNVVEING